MEDTLPEKKTLEQYIIEIANYIKERRETVISISIATLVVISIIIYIFVRLNIVRREAEENLATLQSMVYTGTDLARALSLADDIYQKYKNLIVGKNALFLKGEILYKIGKYKEAADVYKEVNRIMKHKTLSPLALYNLGKSLEGAGEYLQAIDYYLEFTKKYPEHFLMPEVYFSMGLCYLAIGKTEDAVKTFEKIVINYPGSYYQKTADEYLKSLKSAPQTEK